jgi:hypothetical protein
VAPLFAGILFRGLVQSAVMDTQVIVQPLDPPTERAACRLKWRMLDGPEAFRLDYLTGKGWAVAPVESASHFAARDVNLLSSALRDLGVASCFAILTDEITQGPFAYRMPVTEEGLRGFNRELFGLNSLLVPEEESCAILCTVDEVYLVAGPRPFVSAAVGGDIAKARRKFLSFASAEYWPADLRAFLTDVASRYASFEG